MTLTKITNLKKRISDICENLRLLQTKIDVYSERDPFAAEFHMTKYKQLDMECLDLMVRVKELESELPPEVPGEGVNHTVC